MTLKGHTHETYFIAFSSDGKTLASATRNETIKLWDVTMGKLRTTLHSSKVDSEWPQSWLLTCTCYARLYLAMYDI